MPAPRLSILSLGSRRTEFAPFLAALEQKGHRPRPFDAHLPLGEQVAAAELILLCPERGELGQLIDAVAPHVRPRHILWHTDPLQGVVALDKLYQQGIITGRLCVIDPNVPLWFIEGADDIAHTILELLVIESGGKVAAEDWAQIMRSRAEQEDSGENAAAKSDEDNDMPQWLADLWHGLAPSDPKEQRHVLNQMRQRAIEQERDSTLVLLELLERHLDLHEETGEGEARRAP